MINELQYISNNVDYSKKDIDIDTLEIISNKYNIKINNYYKPINSGTISLVFIGYDETSNKKYAVKVKRKNIEEELKKSILYFGRIINFLNCFSYFKKLNLKLAFDENIESFTNQLNFFCEVENIKKFKNLNSNMNNIVIPDVIEFITKKHNNVIIMNFIEGITLKEIDHSDKDKYCKIVTNFGLKSILFDGYFHSDLHQGNILFIKNELYDSGNVKLEYKIGILDFGIIGMISREDQNYFYNFLKFCLNKESMKAAEYFIENMIINNNNLLNDQNVNELIDNINNLIRRDFVINKKVTQKFLYDLNSLLFPKNIRIKIFFTKMQVALAIVEVIVNSLSNNNKSFLDYSHDLINATCLI
jgi:ubiquinone biosynthesis protein